MAEGGKTPAASRAPSQERRGPIREAGRRARSLVRDIFVRNDEPEEAENTVNPAPQQSVQGANQTEQRPTGARRKARNTPQTHPISPSPTPSPADSPPPPGPPPPGPPGPPGPPSDPSDFSTDFSDLDSEYTSQLSGMGTPLGGSRTGESRSETDRERANRERRERRRRREEYAREREERDWHQNEDARDNGARRRGGHRRRRDAEHAHYAEGGPEPPRRPRADRFAYAEQVQQIYIPLNEQEQRELEEIREQLKHTDMGEFLLLNIDVNLERNPGTALQYARAARDRIARLHLGDSATRRIASELHSQNDEDESHFNFVVLPPEASSFAEEDKLFDGDTRTFNKVRLMFPAPARNARFYGNAGDDIIELLQEFTNRQNRLGLSREEFLSLLQQNMGGEPKRVLNQMIIDDASIPEIYRRLVSRFFRHERPREALDKMRRMTWASQTFRSLVEAEIELRRLANLYSFRYRPGANRQVAADHLYTETLINILPQDIQTIVAAREKEQCAHLRRDLYPNELEKLIRRVSDIIDERFVAHANQVEGRKEKGANPKKGKANANKNPNANAGPQKTESSNDSTQNAGQGKGPRRGKANKNANNSNGNANSNSNSNSGANGNSTQPKKGQNNPTQGGNPGKKDKNKSQFFPPCDQPSECQLCGNRRHTAQNCPYFGEGMDTITGQLCELCKCGYHQSKFCPTRRFGPKN